MKINYPGITRQRLAAAIAIVSTYAAENSCTCEQTGMGGRRHRPGCHTRAISRDLEILARLQTLIQKGIQ